MIKFGLKNTMIKFLKNYPLTKGKLYKNNLKKETHNNTETQKLTALLYQILRRNNSTKASQSILQKERYLLRTKLDKSNRINLLLKQIQSEKKSLTIELFRILTSAPNHLKSIEELMLKYGKILNRNSINALQTIIKKDSDYHLVDENDYTILINEIMGI